ncbi:MAG: hypothetical protein LIO90_01695 [Bacteroidales bacterium]|nr:hypothetical protein [Bacteroidales bacterium]
MKTIDKEEDSLQQLKEAWRNTNLRISSLEQENSDFMRRLGNHRLKTLQSRLKEQMTRVLILCFIAMAWLGPALSRCGMPLWFCAVAVVFMGLMALSLLNIRRSVTRVNLSTMSTAEALRGVAKTRALMVRHRQLGLALATPLLVFMIYHSYAEEALLYGILTGIAVGVALGIMLHRRGQRLLRAIQDQLDYELNDDE